MSKVTPAHIHARMDSILDAAMLLFAARGIERTTMQEVASEAGISTGAVYRYFPGKEQLLEAVFDRAIERERGRFEKASDAARSRLEVLAAVGTDALGGDNRSAKNSLTLELALAAKLDPNGIGERVATMRSEVISLIEKELTAAADEGELSPDIDIPSLAVALAALVPGMEILKSSLGELVSTERAFACLGDLMRRTAKHS